MLQMLPVLGRKLFCVNASGFIARDFLGLWSVVCGLKFAADCQPLTAYPITKDNKSEYYRQQLVSLPVVLRSALARYQACGQ